LTAQFNVGRVDLVPGSSRMPGSQTHLRTSASVRREVLLLLLMRIWRCDDGLEGDSAWQWTCWKDTSNQVKSKKTTRRRCLYLLVQPSNELALKCHSTRRGSREGKEVLCKGLQWHRSSPAGATGGAIVLSYFKGYYVGFV